MILEIKFGEKGYQKDVSDSICQASVVIDFFRVGEDLTERKCLFLFLQFSFQFIFFSEHIILNFKRHNT